MSKLMQSSLYGACLVVLLWLPACEDHHAPADAEEEAAHADPSAIETESAENTEAATQDDHQPGDHQHETFVPAPPEVKPAAKPVESKPAAKPLELAPPEQAWVQLDVPSGTPIAVEFDDPLSSGTNLPGDVFHARVVESVMVDGREAIPAGSMVQGFVEDAKSAAGWDKGGLLALRFDLVRLPSGEAVPLVASLKSEEDSAGKKKKAGVIGGSAAGGAILGKIIGKNTKDAAIGAIVGGAIGTGVLAAKKGEEVRIPVASTVFITVEQVFRVSVPA